MEFQTTIIDYGRNIFALEQQRVRAFLVLGDKRAALLDTGAEKADILPLVRSITDLPISLIITHKDRDHIANIGEFTAAFVHEKDIAPIRAQGDYSSIEFIPLEDGTEFDLGGRVLKVIYTPGHTQGSICLLEETEKLLFSGDTVSFGPVYMFGEGRNMPQYRKTLEILQEMAEQGAFDSVYCCHNTCPVSVAAIPELISCVDKIMEGSIEGEPAPPRITAENILLGRVGNSGVLFNCTEWRKKV